MGQALVRISKCSDGGYNRLGAHARQATTAGQYTLIGNCTGELFSKLRRIRYDDASEDGNRCAALASRPGFR
jgi:hypothetical protein